MTTTPSADAAMPQPDGTGLIAHDPWLEPYRKQLRDRFGHYQYVAGKLEQAGGLLGPISQGHHYFGFNRGEQEGKPGVWYREWAPAAYALFLTGDFNGWNRRSHPLAQDPFGTWSIFLPDEAQGPRLGHGSLVKVHVISQTGAMDRIPAYIRRVVQDPDTHGFIGQNWSPPELYAWQNPSPRLNRGLRIYEAHVGMATEEERVGVYDEFTADVLPRVKRLGYNAIQLMAVMEHPYYGSFGYHVSNLFAVSSRCGTPEDLKRLIDTAHGMGIIVLLDVVHSHAVKNTNEGLSRFDGTDQYFHCGPRGEHVAWDSLLFDYAKFEVQRLLLSNLRYWLEEFRFDGFRFDGVTSMLYLNHGLGETFSSYDAYFGGNVDWDAVVYLQLANELVHAVKPDAVTIAEDVSGMAGAARPVAEGGLGFDYRLAMGIPDYWIRLLKEKKDEEWGLDGLYRTLMDRRHNEKHVAYAESHDQALVGDKTLAFWLMDQEMYWNMGKFHQSLVVDRGIALHKMIRLITFSLGGDAYLTFMGNEFGHPEWVDFPRPGNQYSYKYARRQWSLSARDDLKYASLEAFDQAMLRLDDDYNLLNDPFIEQLDVREDLRLLVYRRGPLVFVFNFHPTESYTDHRIPIPDPVNYRLVLDTDEERFSGFARVAREVTYWKQDVPMYTRGQSIQIYIPARTAQVLAPGGGD